jgi:hypothetical protein
LVEAVEGGAPLKAFCNQMSTPAYSIVAQKTIKRYESASRLRIVEVHARERDAFQVLVRQGLGGAEGLDANRAH